MREIGHFIGGKAVKGASGRHGDVFNPNTGEVQAKVDFASKAEVEQAIANAEAAFPAWAATNPQRRARVMFKFLELIQAEYDDLARLLSSEHGKTFADSKGDIQRGLEVVEFACGIPHLMKGEYTEGAGPGIDLYSVRQPLGVVAGITPFNFPAMIPLWKAAPAIACGNTFILKPSERDPSVPTRIAELFIKAGLPEGVLNVVNGDKEAVDTLLTDARVKAIGFVGSSDIAQYIYSTGTSHGKRVQCFGGAKNHMIVMPDADLDQAVDALIGAGYGSAGERCMAISVAVPVGKKTADTLVEKLIPRVESLKVGPSTDLQADYGPMVTKAHLNKVKDYVATGVKEGAKLKVDGRNFKLQGYENGNFMGGCLFDDVTPNMKIYKEEIFGPVLSVVRAKDYEEAVRLPSDHEYGNGVSIFTRDGDTARDFTNRVQVGMVGVNFAIPVPLAYHTFGGWKRSGFGDLNQHGPELDPLLYQDQDGDCALALRDQGRRGVRHSNHEMTPQRHACAPPQLPCLDAGNARGRRRELQWHRLRVARIGRDAPASCAAKSASGQHGRALDAGLTGPRPMQHDVPIRDTGCRRRHDCAGRRLSGQVLHQPPLGF